MNGGVRRDETPRWVRTRARNVLRRPLFLASAAGVAFVASLLGLLLIPREVNRFAQNLAPRPQERPDTASLRASAAGARTALARAESLLTVARERNKRLAAPPLTADTLSVAQRARRDSLRASLSALDQLLERVELAPLPASYRVLGEWSGLRGDERIRPLLDSLAAVEREREAFGLIGGVDPVFVALTARASEVGKTIESIAESTGAQMRRDLGSLLPRPVSVVEPKPAIDTLPLVSSRDTAVVALDRSLDALRAADLRLVELERRETAARELANLAAPPLAMLAAAVVLGAVLGFAVAIAREFWWPLVGDAAEVERLTGTRVLAVIRPRATPPERARRRADQEAPPLIQLTNGDYRLLHDHLAAAGPSSPLITITGEEAGVATVVAANVAAFAANEARSTLLIDADLERSAVAGVMRVRPQPGLGDIIAGRADWAESVVPATVGRDRTVFVLPSGRCDSVSLDDRSTAEIRVGLARMARRYDAVIVVMSLARMCENGVQQLPAPDVVYCARIAHTSLAEVRHSIDALSAAGARVRGVVLWRAEPPHAASREELAAAAQLAERDADVPATAADVV